MKTASESYFAMNKKLLLLFAAACTTCLPTPLRAGPAWFSPDGKGHGRGHGKHQDDDDQGHKHGRYFQTSDRQIILNYYGGAQNLPPGLAKKLTRTGRLPHGWEKRFRPMPVVIERQLPPICVTCGRGVIDGCAVVYDKKTRVILDVLALVDDLRY